LVGRRGRKTPLAKSLGVDEGIIQEWVLEYRVGSCGLGSSASGKESVADSYEHDNELTSSIDGVEFIN
jgi:hypothetical protein